MRNNYLTLTLLLVAMLFLNFQSAFAQCDAVAGEASGVVGEVKQDGSDAANLAVSAWTIEPSGTTDHLFVVLGPEVDAAGDAIIVGVSEADGTFDFSDDGSGEPHQLGTYTFVGFAYNQAELDDLATQLNPLLPVLSLPPIPTPATLANVFSVVGSVVGDLTIPAVESAVTETLPTLLPGFELCFAVAENGHSVEVVLDVGIEDNIVATNDFTTVSNFPNPFSVNTTVSFDVTKPQLVNFSVYDLTGRVVFEQEVSANEGVNEIDFEAADLNSGMYIYTLDNGAESVTKRMIVE